MSEIRYFMPMFDRLTPRTPWTGGRIVDTDPLTLADAASMATKHAGETVTIGDFLRAAARGEITLRAIVHRTTKVEKHDGGIYCNGGQENENKVPAGAIATLPLTACQHLAGTGRASWRTFDGFETVDGVLQRYTKARVLPDEPDFETVPDDCRVVGYDVHALADEYIADPASAQETAAPAPVVAELDYSLLATPAELLDAFGKWGMGAAWFDDLNSRQWLFDARRRKGQGQRGNVIEPLFCPFAVMNGLIEKVRKANRLKPDTAWRTLEHKFPKVYATFEGYDPRERTGD